MTTIEHLIGDLLLRYNCVIVPSFGGFVAKQVSARIDFEKGTMLPPRKSLLFNKQLINNDGLLINEFSQIQGITFDQAQQEVRHMVSSWNRQLRKGKRIELDRIGMLFLDEENNICFEQDRFFNLLLASFGLGQVHFLTVGEVNIIQTETVQREIVDEEPSVVLAPIVELPITIQEKKEEPVTVVAKKKEVSTTKSRVIEFADPKKKRKYWRYVAAACFLPIAFYSIWIPMRTDVLESGVISIKDFNPFYATSEGNYIQTEFIEDVTFEKSNDPTFDQEIESIETDVKIAKLAFTEDTYIFVDISELSASRENSTVETPTAEQVPEVIVEQPIQANARHLIIGCFGNKMNATNLVAKLKSEGFDALIVDVNGGLHRVSAGAALSDEALASMRSKASSLGLTGWVLN